MNVELFRKVQRQIQYAPLKFHMHDIFASYDQVLTPNQQSALAGFLEKNINQIADPEICGSACCIAGWGIYLTTGLQTDDTAIISTTIRSKFPELTQTANIYSTTMYGFPYKVDVRNAFHLAMYLFDIPYSIASALFHTSEWPIDEEKQERYGMSIDWANTEQHKIYEQVQKEIRETAIKLIDGIIKYGSHLTLNSTSEEQSAWIKTFWKSSILLS